MPPLLKVETFVLRAPIEVPVRTSFGTMEDRPAVIVRVEDMDGAYGWGEVWCNFPTCGAEHRGLLIDTVLAPKLLRQRFAAPDEAAPYLELGTRILRLQTRESGPLSQTIAGLDIALWDLYARRRGQPLYRLLGAADRGTVPVYASGINPDGAPETVMRCREEGYRAFKVKIGFGPEEDVHTVSGICDVLADGERLMADANQAWGLDDALDMTRRLEAYPLDWLEEPMPVDMPVADWSRLAVACGIPLAGGENFASADAFREAVEHGILRIVQPDLCKWGGISGCLPVARQVVEARHSYCPHYLGGGIGLLASAHCLAAVGGDGLLEVDTNHNPLRTLLAQPFPRVSAGAMSLSDKPGLGVEPDLEAVAPYLVWRRERCRGS